MPIKADLWARRFYKSIPHASNYPVISNVIMDLGGLVAWSTDVPSTSQVLYGLVPYLGFTSSYDATYVTNHSVQLTGLTLNTIHYFKVQSFRIDALSISDLYSGLVNPVGYAGLVLYSPDTTAWAVRVTVNGNLDTSLLIDFPFSGGFSPWDTFGSTFVLHDGAGGYWELTIDNEGRLATTSGASPAGAFDDFEIFDSVFHTWTLTVSTLGNLTTT